MARDAGRLRSLDRRAPLTELEPLEAFLDRRGLEVIDVVPGAGHLGRRLLLAAPGATRATTAVAIADADDSRRAAENEQEVLQQLRATTDTELTVTIPRVLQRVRASRSAVGLVLELPKTPTGQDTVTRGRTENQNVLLLLKAVDAWLELFESRTACDRLLPAEVGTAGVLWLTGLYPDCRMGAGLDGIIRAQRLLSAHDVRRTAVHGCLCPRHVTVSADRGRVEAVDDWGLASVAGDPLVDLGGFAVRLAGDRLGEVLDGRTTFARTVRSFVTAGLTRLGLPGRLWRELLLLAQVDRAHHAAGHSEADHSLLITNLARDLRSVRHEETRKP
jgi:hypothetical protein